MAHALVKIVSGSWRERRRLDPILEKTDLIDGRGRCSGLLFLKSDNVRTGFAVDENFPALLLALGINHHILRNFSHR